MGESRRKRRKPEWRGQLFSAHRVFMKKYTQRGNIIRNTSRGGYTVCSGSSDSPEN